MFLYKCIFNKPCHLLERNNIQTRAYTTLKIFVSFQNMVWKNYYLSTSLVAGPEVYISKVDSSWMTMKQRKLCWDLIFLIKITKVPSVFIKVSCVFLVFHLLPWISLISVKWVIKLTRVGHMHTHATVSFELFVVLSHTVNPCEKPLHTSLYIRLQTLLRGRRLKGKAGVSGNCLRSQGFKQNHRLSSKLGIFIWNDYDHYRCY